MEGIRRREPPPRLRLDRAVRMVHVEGVSPDALELLVSIGELRIPGALHQGRTHWVPVRELEIAAGSLRARTEAVC
jgi:hypothetical protein